MLQTAATPQLAPSTMKRGHAHKRSAAISGDFDLDFFQKGPSINEALSVAYQAPKPSTSLPSESFLKKPPPALFVTAPQEEDTLRSRSIEPALDRSAATTPSPKRTHHRLNSWAHSMVKIRHTKEPTPKLEYSSNSSNDTTPENVRCTSQSNYSYSSTRPENYQIPEAKIDLDLASGVHYDPANSVVPTKMKNTFHRRTESAPELEDFLKHKLFSTSSNKNSRRNSAIYEEDEDDDGDDDAASGVLSATSSTHHGLNKNASAHSLNSNSSQTRVQSPIPYHSLASTPTSTKTRRGGATAARYQSYYNNNILLASALKSSESLSHVTGNAASLHKPSYASFHSQKSTLVTPTTIPHSSTSSSSSASSVDSSLVNSPSKFKFESKEYDIVPGQHALSYGLDICSTPIAKNTKQSTSTPSPSKKSVSKTSFKSHKKTNSLLSSLNLKIRGGSFSSMKSSKAEIHQARIETADTVEDTLNDDDFEGDSTLTPLNFGEPGPALDLSTMTPKYYNDDFERRDVSLVSNESQTFSHSSVTTSTTVPVVVEPKKSRKHAFLNWMKK